MRLGVLYCVMLWTSDYSEGAVYCFIEANGGLDCMMSC